MRTEGMNMIKKAQKRKRAPAGRGRPPDRNRIPSKRDIQMHLKGHTRVQRALARLVKDLEKRNRELVDDAGPKGTGKGAAVVGRIMNDLIDRIGLVIGGVLACIAIYNAMSATVEAIDNPDVPADTREKLHSNLSDLIESAAKLGCP